MISVVPRLSFVVAVAFACGQPTRPMPASAMADFERAVTVQGVPFVFRAGRMTNLLYQLDCLAELHPCSREAFEAAWRLTDEDRRAIASWRDLRHHYSGTIEDSSRAAPAAPLPIAYHPRDVGTAIRVAGYGARDLEDYAGRLAMFTSIADVARARAIVTRFAARADERWVASRSGLARSVDDYVVLVSRAGVLALVEPIAHFYRVDPAATQQTFELVARPRHDSATSAEQLGAIGVVEVTDGESAAHQLPVIAHEMFHAWFEAAPIAEQRALAMRFASGADPLAGPAFGLLDEVLAAAFGNGLVQRTIDRAEYDRRATMTMGFYNDRHVDAVAKALLPSLEARLAARGTVFDDDFVEDYLRAVHAAFPAGLPPIAYLRPYACVVDPAFPKSHDHLMKLAPDGYSECPTSSADPAIGQAIVDDHRAWGTVILWSRGRLDELAPLVDAPTLAGVRLQAAAAAPFVFASRHDPVGVVFVFVADNDAAMTKLIDTFAARTELRDGVIVP